MKIFDLYNENLHGTKLIEASAGTGKTYTLSGLYVRYIVEKKLLPENILVLTFTKAATAELKTRLRSQLIECRNHLLNQKKIDSNENPQLFELYERYKSSENAFKYIEMSLKCFDQAAIYTINGFCQKVVDDYNSECGSPVFRELIQTKEYVKKYVFEFLRGQQKHKPSEFLSVIPKIDDVIRKIDGLLNKSHYQQVKPDIDWNNTDNLYKEYWKLAKKWQLTHKELLDYVLSGDFHGGSYKEAGRTGYVQDMNGFFINFSGNVLKFKASNIESKLKKGIVLKPMPKFFVEFESFYNKIFYPYNDGSPGNNIAISYMYACFKFVQFKLNDLLTEQGMYDYSDQIKVVHNAVNSNQRLVNQIANQWQCVMVDEFQDTDQRQLDIFERCFNDGKHDLIYVGDPKQAIYDFRGADVFVYNKAKLQTQQKFNLATNWRSSNRILQASNLMFDRDLSFQYSWLRFVPSMPKPDQKIQLQDKYGPVAVIDCPENERLTKLAIEIKRFLAQGKLNDSEIKPESCAILVKSNNEAMDLYEYLITQNIKVSLWSDSGVFSTDSATNLYYLIRAINYPSKKNIFTALNGLFFSVSLNDLHQLNSDQLLAEFVQYKSDCHVQNITQVILQMFDEKHVFTRLLQRIDGERHYTDTQHLLELMQTQIDIGTNINEIETWLAEHILNADAINVDDEGKRRIESDSKKISIMTIHKSKGLEFDHIFIPFADKIKVPTYRENKNIKACCATHDENNVAKIYWKHSNKAAKHLEREKRADITRNLYVAITRAKHRVYLGIDSSNKNAEAFPITELIKQIENDTNLYSVVEELITPLTLNEEPTVNISNANQLRRFLDKPQTIYSFSGLSKRQEIPYEILESNNTETDFNDYFQFPKGSKSGTMQHEILENLAFDAKIDDIKSEVVAQLDRNNFDCQWADCLSHQINKILNTCLWKNGPNMSQIKNHIDEMEFMLPVKSISNTTISQWLSQHRKQPTEFVQDNLKGYLTGFIDLVFEHNEKFYVVDYKSNYLGSKFTDYTSDRLKEAIEHHFYDLQYLLYSVALIKYLQINLNAFDLTKHFGGVAYLFTRGINGEPGQGIYYHLPEKKLLMQMVDEFHGS